MELSTLLWRRFSGPDGTMWTGQIEENLLETLSDDQTAAYRILAHLSRDCRITLMATEISSVRRLRKAMRVPAHLRKDQMRDVELKVAAAAVHRKEKKPAGS